MKTNLKAFDPERGHDILLAEYVSLSNKINLETAVYRLIAVGWTVLSIWMIEIEIKQLISISISALFTGVMWKLVIEAKEKTIARLEKAILEISVEEDNNDTKKAYINSRYVDRKHRRMMQFVNYEPFLWIILALGIIAIKLFI